MALTPLAAAIAALLILIAGGAWYFFGANRPAPARLSVVVLPFANLSGDPAQDYLVDALTDELTTSLARIRDSFVIASNTAFAYKGKPVDAKAIGKDLGVRYVLEGSVLPSGNQVRVNAQLIDASSGAHLWVDEFDTPRADLLQMQDAIVARLGRAMDVQLPIVEAARLKRTPAANPDAEDLALQCEAALRYIGKESEPGYRLCEQALAADPNDVRAIGFLSLKFIYLVELGLSADPKADLQRADEMVSRALAVDPNSARTHRRKARILTFQGHLDEGIAENERALALDPAAVYAYANLGWNYLYLGQFEKSLEYSDKAIRLSPFDGDLGYWYLARAAASFGLKQYDQTIEAARWSIAINPSTNPWSHFNLIAALALSGREAEAHEALQRYLASVPTGPRTVAAWKAAFAQCCNAYREPRYLETWDRYYDGHSGGRPALRSTMPVCTSVAQSGRPGYESAPPPGARPPTSGSAPRPR